MDKHSIHVEKKQYSGIPVLEAGFSFFKLLYKQGHKYFNI